MVADDVGRGEHDMPAAQLVGRRKHAHEPDFPRTADIAGRDRAANGLPRADLPQQGRVAVAAAIHVEAHARPLHQPDGVHQPVREVEHGRHAKDAAAHGLPAAPEPDVEERPHREVADGQRAHRRSLRQVLFLGVPDDPGKALRLSQHRNRLGHQGDDVLRHGVDAVARIKVRELRGNRTLAAEAGFERQFPALPPDRHVHHLRPPCRDHPLRDLVCNGSHGAPCSRLRLRDSTVRRRPGQASGVESCRFQPPSARQDSLRELTARHRGTRGTAAPESGCMLPSTPSWDRDHCKRFARLQFGLRDLIHVYASGS